MVCMGGSEVLRYLDLELDVEARTCTCAGQPVRLTPREFDILRVFMQNQGRTMRTQDIYDEVWGPSRPGRAHQPRRPHPQPALQAGHPSTSRATCARCGGAAIASASGYAPPRYGPECINPDIFGPHRRIKRPN